VKRRSLRASARRAGVEPVRIDSVSITRQVTRTYTSHCVTSFLCECQTCDALWTVTVDARTGRAKHPWRACPNGCNKAQLSR
jgi:hypothetical protein